MTSVLAANDDYYQAVENETLTITNATQCVGGLPELYFDVCAPIWNDVPGSRISVWNYPNYEFDWGFSGEVTLADVQSVRWWDDNILVAWQVYIDEDAQAYADANGIQIIAVTDPQPGDLWNELLQAAMNQQGCVLANDASGSGNPLTAQLVTGPNNGQLTLNADGSFSYAPAAASGARIASPTPRWIEANLHAGDGDYHRLLHPGGQ